MTETPASPEATADTDLPRHPSDVLINLIVALLAPMFLSASGDIRFARMAALETVNAYRARNQADLMAIAQIIGCGLAALGSLSLSMADNLSLSMTLRLSGNAVALNRSVERNRRALKEKRPDTAMTATPLSAPEPEPDEDSDEAELVASVVATQKRAAEARAHLQGTEPVADRTPSPAPAPITAAPIIPPTPPAPTTAEDKRHRALWAAAMTEVAGKYTAGLANLPPAERKVASIRAAALTSTANALLSGAPMPRLRPGALGGMMTHSEKPIL